MHTDCPQTDLARRQTAANWRPPNLSPRTNKQAHPMRSLSPRSLLDLEPKGGEKGKKWGQNWAKREPKGEKCGPNWGRKKGKKGECIRDCFPVLPVGQVLQFGMQFWLQFGLQFCCSLLVACLKLSTQFKRNCGQPVASVSVCRSQWAVIYWRASRRMGKIGRWAHLTRGVTFHLFMRPHGSPTLYS